jgi:hypothetical protein
MQSILIQTSQTGGQWYSDISPFSISLSSQSLYHNLSTNIAIAISGGLNAILLSQCPAKYHSAITLYILILPNVILLNMIFLNIILLNVILVNFNLLSNSMYSSA